MVNLNCTLHPAFQASVLVGGVRPVFQASVLVGGCTVATVVLFIIVSLSPISSLFHCRQFHHCFTVANFVRRKNVLRMPRVWEWILRGGMEAGDRCSTSFWGRLGGISVSCPPRGRCQGGAAKGALRT